MAESIFKEYTCDEKTAYRNRLLDFRNHSGGYIELLGITLSDVGDDYAVCEVPISEKLGNPIGTVHGGLLFSICDTAAGSLVMYISGKNATTVSADIHYLVAVKKDTKRLYAKAKLVRAGTRIVVCDVRLEDEKETLIAKATVTHYLLDLNTILCK